MIYEPRFRPQHFPIHVTRSSAIRAQSPLNARGGKRNNSSWPLNVHLDLNRCKRSIFVVILTLKQAIDSSRVVTDLIDQSSRWIFHRRQATNIHCLKMSPTRVVRWSATWTSGEQLIYGCGNSMFKWVTKSYFVTEGHFALFDRLPVTRLHFRLNLCTFL